jgi:hypothetical protein
MRQNYKPPFIKFVKKAHKPLQLAVEDEIENICLNPDAGEEKVGDLAGIWVSKFKFNRQEYLIAYRSSPPGTKKGKALDVLLIDFYQIGQHENFYSELKRYLKSED